MTTRAAFAPSGSMPFPHTFPGVVPPPPGRRAFATTPLLRLPHAIGRTFGLPSLRPTLNCALHFRACSGKARTGHRGGIDHGRLPCRPIPIQGALRISQVSGPSSLHAPKSNMPPEPPPSCPSKRWRCSLRGFWPIGPPGKVDFDTESPGSRIRPPTHHPPRYR